MKINNNNTMVYSSPKKDPSSQTKTNLSTSGSTAIPKSALFDTNFESLDKFIGKGSGL